MKPTQNSGLNRLGLTHFNLSYSTCIYLLLTTFIFLNPFPRITAIKEIVFYTAVLLVIISIVKHKVKISFRSFLTSPFLFFTAWTMVGLFFSLDRTNSLHAFYSHLIKYILFYYILINYFKTKKHLYQLSVAIIVSATLFSVVSLIFFYGVNDFPLNTRFGITFKNCATNVMGFNTVFAMLLSLFMVQKTPDPKLRIPFFACALILFAASVLTQSRGTILSIAASLPLVFIHKINVRTTILAFVLILLALIPLKNRLFELNLPENSNNVRMAITLFSIEIIKDHPIFGTGFDTDTLKDKNLIDPEIYLPRISEPHRKIFKTQEYILPHSMLLSIAVRLGLVGLGLYLWILGTTAVILIKLIRHGRDKEIKTWARYILAAFIMFFIKGLVEPVSTHFCEVIFHTILGMATILWKINENSKSARLYSKNSQTKGSHLR